MEIIIPIGISGSGKTRLYKMKYNNLAIVSPDEIRKELTGNISDQTHNKEVFQEVDRRIDELVEKNDSFFYDATNLNTRFRKEFVNKFIGTDIKIVYIILPSDVETSYKRIRQDIDNKIDRSNVPFEVLLKQYEMYKTTTNSDFCGENVQEIIYIKPNELD